MSPYEALRHRCIEIDFRAWAQGNSKVGCTSAMLAEVLRTLREVTPEMVEAWYKVAISNLDVNTSDAKADFLAMLDASPLAPPKEPGK